MTPNEIAKLWREALATTTPALLVTLSGAVIIARVRHSSGEIYWLAGPIRKGSTSTVVALDSLAAAFELFEAAGIEIPCA